MHRSVIAWVGGLVTAGILAGALVLSARVLQADGPSNENLAARGLGEVRYSVLDPDAFGREHGPGWILADGRQIKDTALAAKHGIERAPDARGVFLRGRTWERKASEGGDPAGQRAVGAWQGDELKSHGHPTKVGYSGGPHGGAGSAFTYHDPRGDAESAAVGSTGGDETRPRNIALNVYIKVQ